jgi:hypothetical protein
VGLQPQVNCSKEKERTKKIQDDMKPQGDHLIESLRHILIILETKALQALVSMGNRTVNPLIISCVIN